MTCKREVSRLTVYCFVHVPLSMSCWAQNHGLLSYDFIKYDFIGTDKLVINAKIGFGKNLLSVACLFTRGL